MDIGKKTVTTSTYTLGLSQQEFYVLVRQLGKRYNVQTPQTEEEAILLDKMYKKLVDY